MTARTPIPAAAMQALVQALQAYTVNYDQARQLHQLVTAACRPDSVPEGIPQHSPDDPSYMHWPVLNRMLWDRARDDDRDQNPSAPFATLAETVSLLSWSETWHRRSLPRTEEEERTYAIISRAAKQMESPPSD